MSEAPKELLYTKDHEWVKREGDLLLVGITEYAAHSLGDIVYLDLFAPGSEVNGGENFGTIESVKAAEDLYAPVSATIAETNEALKESPEQVNSAPYDSWMVKLKGFSQDDLNQLLDHKAYNELIASL